MQACHNCRRRRLRCDRSVPQCVKCQQRGEECQGYQRLLRWREGVSTSSQVALVRRQQIEETPRPSLTSPLLQGVDRKTKAYLIYFADTVLNDLVLRNAPEHNPLRQLIPMIGDYPILLEVIIANSALHTSHRWRRALAFSQLACNTTDISSAVCSMAYAERSTCQQDALNAKQRTLSLLRAALAVESSLEPDIVLAVILLLAEFELIDAGRDNWKFHIQGAKKVIGLFQEAGRWEDTTLPDLRKCLLLNILVYVEQINLDRHADLLRFDVFGSVFRRWDSTIMSQELTSEALSLLQDQQGNHCSFFPAALLELILAGSRLLHRDQEIKQEGDNDQELAVLRLLQLARSFSACDWSKSMVSHTPVTDHDHRIYIATAHRAAVMIYLFRVLLHLQPAMKVEVDLQAIVEEINLHLVEIKPDNILYTATTWPTFIAGAEATTPENRDFARARLKHLWEIEPWDNKLQAVEVLQSIWSRDSSAGQSNWLQALLDSDIEWLIL